ncbi:MAG: hemerythrin domain-containing protein [Thalassovita sp.]
MSNQLELRDGLPEHLQVLRELYPRDMWTGHAHFNGLTAFWLERHGMFRQVMTRLVGDTQAMLEARAPRYGAEMPRLTGFLLDQLHGHHGIEDDHYFPMFRGLDARLQDGFDLLDADHHALHDHMERLATHSNAVLRGFQAGEVVRDEVGSLLAVQEGFQRFLTRHLEDEEDLIVPIILEYGADMA